jgi:hypothetical protein
MPHFLKFLSYLFIFHKNDTSFISFHSLILNMAGVVYKLGLTFSVMMWVKIDLTALVEN